MQRRHFEIIARTLKEAQPEHNGMGTHEAYLSWEKVVEAFCVMSKQQNPRFNRDRFLKACGATE